MSSLLGRLIGWDPDLSTRHESRIANHEFWAMVTQECYGLSTRQQIVDQFQILDADEQSELDGWLADLKQVMDAQLNHLVLLMHYEHSCEVAAHGDAESPFGDVIQNTARYQTISDVRSSMDQAKSLVLAGRT